MAQKLVRLGIQREHGYLYYISGTQVMRAPMKNINPTGRKGLVERADFDREAGYLYFLDRDGDIARTKMAKGGQARTKPAAKKKPAARKKPVVKKKPATKKRSAR